MRDGTSRDDHSTLTASAFDQLLAALDAADRDRAGEKYELIRRKLLTFFTCRASPRPDEDADETISRVARRLDEGERIDNLPAYVYGVAHFVLLEASRERHKEFAALQQLPIEPLKDEDPGDTPRTACLERCLAALPPPGRDLLISYYEGPDRERIRRRRELAQRRGMLMNALRIRVHRLRATVESCVRRCLLQAK
jgi:DNA-directed RNA polymerase specialized sigma24 family protein